MVVRSRPAIAINSAGAGVSASIVNDGNGARLVLTSANTGAANGFEVNVTDSNGTDANDSALGAIAYFTKELQGGLLADLSLPPLGLAAVALLPGASAVLAMLTARAAAYGALARMP